MTEIIFVKNLFEVHFWVFSSRKWNINPPPGGDREVLNSVLAASTVIHVSFTVYDWNSHQICHKSFFKQMPGSSERELCNKKKVCRTKFELYENDADDCINISFFKKKTGCGDIHYKSHKLRSLYPLLHSLLVILIYRITACCWIWCPCIRSPFWKTDPRWTNPHYSLQCVRTQGTTCDTYKWLACTVCLRQNCCRGWPDGLWSTLLCNTHAAGPSPKRGTWFTIHMHL